MIRFLVRLLIFFLPFILISYALDVFLSENLKRSPSFALREYHVWNDLYSGNINADIVVVGSSRAVTHFNVKMMTDSLHKPAYDIGITGFHFGMQYLRNRLLLSKSRKPKVEIVSLDIYTPGQNLMYNPDQFLPYLLYDSLLKKLTSGYKVFNTLDYYLPLTRYYGKTKAISTALKMFISPEHPNRPFANGYYPETMPFQNDVEKKKKTMKYYEPEWDSSICHLFEKYLAECKQQGIYVVLVYSPEYIEGQKFTHNRDKYISAYRKYADNYGIPFLDYSSNPLCRDTAYFYNAMHLNEKGANYFTSVLIKDLKKIPAFNTALYR